MKERKKYTILDWNLEKGHYNFKTSEASLIYTGDSLLRALYFLLRMKYEGSGCVHFEWR